MASAANLSAQGIAFNTVGRRAILADPQFRNGRYYEEDEGPQYGLALARMLAHITYLSEASIEMKFGRRLQDSDTFAYDLMRETEFQIESYLHYQGRQFVERFDANSYLHLTKAMDYFHLSQSYSSLAAALSRTAAAVSGGVLHDGLVVSHHPEPGRSCGRCCSRGRMCRSWNSTAPTGTMRF